MSTHFHEPEIFSLDTAHGPFTFPDQIDKIRFTVEWTSKSRMVCDLKLHIYCYDERVSASLILDITNNIFSFCLESVDKLNCSSLVAGSIY